MKRMILSALAGLILLTGCVSVNFIPEASLVPKLNHLAVEVHNPMGGGSGVWIGSDMVLTAKHVVLGYDGMRTDLTIKDLQGTTYRAEVIAWDKEAKGFINHDWAILKVKGANRAHYARSDCGDRYVGERVVGFGNAHLSTGLIPYLGYIQKVHYDVSANAGSRNYWSDAILTNMDGAPGVSGGPVFDMDGELIGLMVGAFQDRGAGAFQQITYPVRAIWPLCG